ncbi:MAG: hypothetical protein RIR97_1549 [Pseudomonadota bacterium]
MALKVGSILAVLSVILMVLSGCNTTDALTPQVDIPNGAPVSSQPVTQSDLDQMAKEPSLPAPIPQQDIVQPNTLQPPVAQTLDAQAERLKSGQQTTAQTLPQQNAQAPAAVAQNTNATIRFLPIIGAPVKSVAPLSKQLGTEARMRGLTIVPSDDQGVNHVLKGYLNAFTDGNKTTVIYVWDILDKAGTRLHRIQGQGSIPLTAGDPWSVVPETLMQQIATRTMNEYTTWRQSQ